MTDSQVLPVHPRTKDEVSNALAADWLRLCPIGERVTFAAKVGACGPKTISRAISGENLPEAHTILNSLLVDTTALFNVFQRFGGCFVRTSAAPEADMLLISQLLHAASEAFDRKRDGAWCHRDKAALADIFRQLVPAMLSIILEADKMKGGGR